MKTKTIFAMVAAFAILAMFACTKQVVTNPHTVQLADNYFYKVVDLDMDSTQPSTTGIYVVKGGMVTVDAVGVPYIATIAVNDDDHHKYDGDYCHKHPKDVHCLATPVTFTNVSFIRDGGYVNCIWTAQTEINVKCYQVIRSTDQSNWAIVGRVKPKGEGTTYVFIDNLIK